MKLSHSKYKSTISEEVSSSLYKGSSYTFAKRKATEESFYSSISSSVTIDIPAKLFGELIEWKNLPNYPLPVQIFELRNFEKTLEQLNALESITGILNELTPEQLEIFEEEIKRRPLFE